MMERGLSLSVVRKPPRVRVWRESVDALMFAACAYVTIAYRGSVYGLGVFVVIERTSTLSWDWRDLAQARLKMELREKYGGALPFIRDALEEDYRDL